ncbi:hypothetical protein C8R47DRAFT_1225891 [Mycena vitilis]|nr:hypothetical protein C8R47DRAFT_1225891 [Mycena vitilis]
MAEDKRRITNVFWEWRRIRRIGENVDEFHRERVLAEWEVDAVLDAKVRWKSLYYFVSWKGYSAAHNQWVKHSDFFGPDALAAFYEKYPAKPRQIARASFDALPFRNTTLRVRSMRRGAAFQGGDDVRGTPLSHGSARRRPRSADRSGPPTRPTSSGPPSRADAAWHSACDHARDLGIRSRSLRSRAPVQ